MAKRMLSFLFVDKRKLFAMTSSFEEFNLVFYTAHRSAWLVLNQQGSEFSEDTWGTSRALRWKKSTFLKENFCVWGTRTQPLSCVGCSVHYWVSCAINKEGFFEIAFVVVGTHLPRFEAIAYFAPVWCANSRGDSCVNGFHLCYFS